MKNERSAEQTPSNRMLKADVYLSKAGKRQEELEKLRMIILRRIEGGNIKV